jgi:peptidoglycan hydrolase-like protein with peptidoglycan-binding domain
MLLSHVLSGPGPLAGTASVEGLQRALANLAIATTNSSINPGPIDGVVGGQTVAAVNAALSLITKELPSWLYVGLQAALLVGSTTTQAKAYVTQYAPQLTIAANTAAIKFKTPTPAPMTIQTMASNSLFDTVFPANWYKKPSLGLALVLLGAFGFYKFFLASPAPTKPTT